MGAQVAGTRDTRVQKSDLPSRPSICARYQRADQVLGKRWVSLILHTLLDRSCRFSELTAWLMVSDRTLSARLGELEAQGIVERHVDPDAKPVRVAYTLTAKGRALEPVLRETARWADCWMREE